MKKKITAEEICKSVQGFHSEVVELAESVIFMQEKLEETREMIKDEPLVIEYDNGGGQSGIRENPSFVSYEKLFASYSKGLKTLMEIIEANGGDSKQVSSFEERRARLRIAK